MHMSRIKAKPVVLARDPTRLGRKNGAKRQGRCAFSANTLLRSPHETLFFSLEREHGNGAKV